MRRNAVSPPKHGKTMLALSVTQMVIRPNDATTSRITDLIFGPGDWLYSTTRFDGQITAWHISGTNLTPADDVAYASPLIAGNDPTLVQVQTSNGPTVLSAGGTNGALTLYPIPTGTFGTTQTLTLTFGHPLVQAIPIGFDDGTTRIYAGNGGDGGLLSVDFDSAGTITATTAIADDGSLAIGDVTALGHATVDDLPFLYAASSQDLGLTAFEIASSGALLPRDTLRVADGLRIAAPTAIETVTFADETYLILADAGSSSLTVLQPDSSGRLTIIDYVIDDRTTRFEGVTDVTSVERDDEVWVFAGGTDDGISVFQMIPGGRLIHRGAFADTTESTLANVAALAAHEVDGGIDLYAASASEAGLTRLHLSLSPEDEVIIDGMGVDLLTGGDGADLFVLSADGRPDTIADFNVGEDALDLGAWNGLRSKSQLFFDERSDGIQITYGEEELRVIAADGNPISEDALDETDLFGAARIPQTVTAGLPGPVTTPPTLPDRYIPPPGAPTPPSPIDRIEHYGSGGVDDIRGGSGHDLLFGQAANDHLRGLEGDDLLFGGPDADRLEGGAGDDQLFGGSGREVTWATPSEPVDPQRQFDSLYGGPGDDLLVGEAGRDLLDGGTGDDRLFGGSGRDTFVFRSGHDVIADFSMAMDLVMIDPTLLDGQSTGNQIAADFGTIVGDDVVLTFSDESTLTLEDFSDLASLQDVIGLL